MKKDEWKQSIPRKKKTEQYWSEVSEATDCMAQIHTIHN